MFVSTQGPAQVPEPAERVRAHAENVLARLQNGDLVSVLDQFHFPPHYTAEQVRSDKAGMAEVLELLLSDFGVIQNFTIEDPPEPFHNVGVSAGDLDYWRSLPNYGLSIAVEFRVATSRRGTRVIQVTYFSPSKPTIRSIEFGIPARQPNSKAELAELQSLLVQHMKTRRPIE